MQRLRGGTTHNGLGNVNGPPRLEMSAWHLRQQEQRPTLATSRVLLQPLSETELLAFESIQNSVLRENNKYDT
jgi:hypothetical protein